MDLPFWRKYCCLIHHTVVVGDMLPWAISQANQTRGRSVAQLFDLIHRKLVTNRLLYLFLLQQTKNFNQTKSFLQSNNKSISSTDVHSFEIELILKQ